MENVYNCSLLPQIQHRKDGELAQCGLASMNGANSANLRLFNLHIFIRNLSIKLWIPPVNLAICKFYTCEHVAQVSFKAGASGRSLTKHIQCNLPEYVISLEQPFSCLILHSKWAGQRQNT